jgi:hypothetical protein
MVEPISTALAGIALVKASVDGIKSAIGTAKDVRDIASQLDGLLTGHRQVQQQANQKAGGFSNFDSVGSTAAEMIDKKLADEALYEVGTLIDLRFGHGTFAAIKQEHQRRLKAKREEVKRQAQQKAAQRKEMMEDLWTVFIVLTVLVAALVVGLVAWVAMADDRTHVVCRLAGCEMHDGLRHCQYRGANNTTELMTYHPTDYIPSEYLCEYAPNKKKPLTLKQTLDAIKEAMQ